MKTALILAVTIMLLALGLLLGEIVRSHNDGPQITPYAHSRIRDAVRRGNPPNLTGSPDSPGYGKPNISPDVARRYGGEPTAAPAAPANN